MNKSTARWALPGAVVLFGVMAVGGWLYFALTARSDKAGDVVEATPAKEIKDAPKEEVTIPKVTVYKSPPALKKKLTLPQAVINDPKESVFASSKIAAGEHAKTVTTVINTETGKSETYVRTDQLPWFAVESRGEVGLYYGLKGGQQAVRVHGRQDFVQVKALHLGVIGSVDMVAGRKPDSYIGVGVGFRW